MSKQYADTMTERFGNGRAKSQGLLWFFRSLTGYLECLSATTAVCILSVTFSLTRTDLRSLVHAQQRRGLAL